MRTAVVRITAGLALLVPAVGTAQSNRPPAARPPLTGTQPARPDNTQRPAPHRGPQLGDALQALSRQEIAEFERGLDVFLEEEDAGDGLGPVFNDTSCASCHDTPAIGGGSDRLVTRFGTTTGGRFDPLEDSGGSLIQSDGIGEIGSCTYGGETVPAEATIVAHRRTTPLFGLGLVDTLPDSWFHQQAARQRRVSPATAGRPNFVTSVVTGNRVVGKFGWKSQVPSLFQFSGDAYLNEMGITSPLFPEENCPQGDCTALACDPVEDPEDDGEDVELFASFMRFLAAPTGPPNDDSTRSARALFARTGCASCHLPAVRSGRSTVRALDRVVFRPYSDFLLHDMGSLGDGIEQGEASRPEMRTAPLWGLNAVTSFLHDGRASTIEEAILAHEGQGRGARDRFRQLSPRDRQVLLDFLERL